MPGLGTACGRTTPRFLLIWDVSLALGGLDGGLDAGGLKTCPRRGHDDGRRVGHDDPRRLARRGLRRGGGARLDDLRHYLTPYFFSSAFVRAGSHFSPLAPFGSAFSA